MIGAESGKVRDGLREVSLLVTVHQSEERIANDIAKFILVNSGLTKLFVTQVPAGECEHKPVISRKHRWFKKSDYPPSATN